MPVQINRSTLQKLTDPSSEIRLRTLEQIDAKIQRALGLDEPIDFNPGELCKQLIRWFGFQPIQTPLNVLKLLVRILESSYGDSAVRQLGGSSRFLREMCKVKKLLRGREEELEVAVEIEHILQGILARESGECEELMESLEQMNIRDDGSAASAYHGAPDYPPEGNYIRGDYEESWSRPTVADYTSLKLIADMLGNAVVPVDELQNVLEHLQLCMLDYPAEFMLQPPHVFRHLLTAYERAEQMNYPLGNILTTISIFLRSLRDRLRLRRKCLSYAAVSARPTSVEQLALTQLKVEKALKLLLETTLNDLSIHLYEFRKETSYILEIISDSLDIYGMQHLCVERLTLMKLLKMSNQLTECCEQDDNFSLKRIEQLSIIFLLQDMAENNAQRQPLDVEVLEPLLRDYSVKMGFPLRQERLKRLLFPLNPALEEKYKNLQNYEQSYVSAVALLKSPQCYAAADVLQMSGDICPTLSKLKSVKLVECLLASIFACNPQSITDTDLRQKIDSLLLRLLQLEYEPLRGLVYSRLSQAVKKHFSCLMSGEKYAGNESNAKLLEAQIIGVPLSSAVLYCIVNESFEGSSEAVRKSAEDILTLLLKSQHLLGANFWASLLDVMQPVLPLLQSCTFSPKLMELLLQLYDPNAQNIAFIEVLRGNVGFLFHPDSAIRSEALTRIIYILDTLPKSNDYDPNILQISDVIPDDLCVVNPPRPYSHIFAASEAFSDLATLQNLLMILETADTGPSIRKSTLMQLNLMCQNYDLTRTICEESACNLPLIALENAMRKSSYEYYVDCAIPAIGIISKVLFCDGSLRTELSSTPNPYVLLLRALFFFLDDQRLKQDASVCLFQLVFSSCIVASGPQSLRLPRLLSNLKLPLTCSFDNSSFPPSVSECSIIDCSSLEIFSSPAEENAFLRQLIAISFCGDHTKLDSKYVRTQNQQHDIAPELHASHRDLRLLKASLPEQNLKRLLQAISNATEHTKLINGVTSLKLLLLLCRCEPSSMEDEQLGTDLYDLVGKYLKLPPNNEMDSNMYEHILDLCDMCVRMRMTGMIVGLLRSLQTDYQHGILTLLKAGDIPLRLYRKMCQILINLLSAGSNDQRLQIASPSDSAIFCSNLFDISYEITNKFFDRRELLRVRCLLPLMGALATFELNMPDRLLLFYCKQFVRLSVSLKSYTFTGAAWQRDCLQLVCRLHGQMEQPTSMFILGPNVIRFFSGMGGHSDAQVRALSWCVLAFLTQYRDSEVNGSQSVISELSFLPGGFVACCLSTLLDANEIILVRQMAGNLFADLLPSNMSFEDAVALLEQHAFFGSACKSLLTYRADPEFPRHEDLRSCGPIITCEIVSCYCRICLQLLDMSPANGDFMGDLCQTAFMYNLYELLKSDSCLSNPAYYPMCAFICQLYAKCSHPDDFNFLQRTLCSDPMWLASFVQLLDQPNADDTMLVYVVQLLIVLVRDPLAAEQLYEIFAFAPERLVRLFRRGLQVVNINSPLQRSVLATLSLMLVKAQPAMRNDDDVKCFADVLCVPVEIEMDAETQNVPCRGKENNSSASNRAEKALQTLRERQKARHTLPATHKPLTNREPPTAKSRVPSPSPSVPSTKTIATDRSTKIPRPVAEYIFLDIFRLFSHLYPLRSCKFDSAPSPAKVQIAETLAILLRVSASAEVAANNMKLLDRILKIFKAFFEEFNMPCTTFVRRYGEARKMAIVKNFKLLLNVILNWYSNNTAMLTDAVLSLELTKILMQIWPWLSHSATLKLLTLQMCVAISEMSFVVCKRFAAVISPHPTSLLQNINRMVSTETLKVKAADSESLPIIRMGVRVLTNCCSCMEGRVALIKARTLDIFDGLHPFNIKSPRIKLDILLCWLQFWELFSRYSEGAAARHLIALCDVTNRSPPRSPIRLLTLKILRNMCFLDGNRSSLMTSVEFIHIVDAVIAQPMDPDADDVTYKEQLLVGVGLWKLLTGGVKYVAMVRGTKLGKKIRILREQLTSIEEEDKNKLQQLPDAEDLACVLDVILGIFNKT